MDCLLLGSGLHAVLRGFKRSLKLAGLRETRRSSENALQPGLAPLQILRPSYVNGSRTCLRTDSRKFRCPTRGLWRPPSRTSGRASQTWLKPSAMENLGCSCHEPFTVSGPGAVSEPLQKTDHRTPHLQVPAPRNTQLFFCTSEHMSSTGLQA